MPKKDPVHVEPEKPKSPVVGPNKTSAEPAKPKIPQPENNKTPADPPKVVPVVTAPPTVKKS